jgi:hypothetical protein
MNRRRLVHLTVVCVLTAALGAALGGCGILGVEGSYNGSVHGSMTVIGVPVPVSGNLDFDLVATGEDNYSASGLIKVRNKSTGQVTYEATLGGGYELGDLRMTFKSTDGKSSGTIHASTLAGRCWNNGTWTLSGFATSGKGTWSGCRY